MTIIENLSRIYEEAKRINPSCEIVAATKTRTVSEIAEAWNTGMLSAAGENRVQELCDKYTDKFIWDFIGRLQTNKVKYIIDKVRLIHGLDRISLAEVLEKEGAKRNITANVLIEINSGKEENKGGIFLEDVEKFLDEISRFPHIRACGMMAVTPLEATPREDKNAFDKIYKVFDRLKNENFRYLSMGMSGNYLIALESGANIIRPGRVIFGERAPYGRETETGGNNKT